MNEFTTERSMEAASLRVCWVCGAPVTELKKASYLPVGLGLRLVGHEDCVQELIEAHKAREQQERQAWEAVDRLREITREQNTMKKHLR